jgi:hypothetical protein
MLQIDAQHARYRLLLHWIAGKYRPPENIETRGAIPNLNVRLPQLEGDSKFKLP